MNDTHIHCECCQTGNIATLLIENELVKCFCPYILFANSETYYLSACLRIEIGGHDVICIDYNDLIYLH